MKLIIRQNKHCIYVLSPSGYLVDSCEIKDFVGSMFEADCSRLGTGERLDRLSNDIENRGK